MQEKLLNTIAIEAKKISDFNPLYPITQHVYLARDKGIELSEKLNGNRFIVEIGTYLMDCEIGTAIKEGRIQDHIQLSLQKAKELFDKYPELDSDIRTNLEQCILQHHGGLKFHSIEAEICCNADCYRFASLKGVALGLRYFRDYEFETLISLLSTKLEEKHSALTLNICIDELEPQYPIIKELFKSALAS
jgi:hypothetical protein